MDIDRLGMDERTELMRKGACFNCRQVGHIAKDCPRKQWNGGGNQSNQALRGKALHAHIRTLMGNLTEQEREEALEIFGEEGF
jgi:hypothetical protein